MDLLERNPQVRAGKRSASFYFPISLPQLLRTVKPFLFTFFVLCGILDKVSKGAVLCKPS